MPLTAQHPQAQLHLLKAAAEDGTLIRVQQMLLGMTAADIAHLLESSPPKSRAIVWNLIEEKHEADILQHLSDDVRSHFIKNMETRELLSVLDGLEPDDIADILQDLPRQMMRQVLHSMDQENRARLEQVLSYPEDTAGGLMNTDTITIRAKMTLHVVQRYLRRHESLPEMTDALFVVNRRGEFVGALPLATILVSDPSVTVREVMLANVKPILSSTSAAEVASKFERHDLISAPVVNEEGIVLGRITVDDVVDVIRDEADHSLMSTVGLDEDEDTFAPVLQSSKRRAVWLGVNLLTALIASGVIGLFQETIEKVVALAVLMPLVASMGGIAGTQTLTLAIRGMALGQIGAANARWFLIRELGVGLFNGLVWAAVVGGLASYWFSDPLIGGLIAAAILINLLVAALSGAVIPQLLQKLRIDPVLAGGVLLTTLTDVMGFLSFLGLASYFYV